MDGQTVFQIDKARPMEILLQIVIWIVEVFGETVLQVLVELIAELFGQVIQRRRTNPEPTSPWVAALGYVVFGAVAGFITLWLVPDLFLKNHAARMANVIFTPIVSGLFMAWVGHWRRRHQGDLIRLDTFGYAYLFALPMALVRFTWGE